MKPIQEDNAVNDYLSGHATLAEAQDKFCKPVEEKFKSTHSADDLEGLLWGAWSTIVKVAKSIGDDAQRRQKLVDLVLAVQQRPTLQKGDTVCQVWDATVWSDLPVFGAEIRESWNFAASDTSSSEEQQQWLNLNAFVACLVATAHKHADQPNFTLYAVWALREAFEDSKRSKIATEAAAAWLTYASPALHELSMSQTSFDGRLARSGSLYQDEEWKGFNSDRWQKWVSRLHEVNADDFDARGKELLTSARQEVSKLQ